MWNDTDAARRLGIAVPIIQGPFGGGMSSVELVAAVSGAGRLGAHGVQIGTAFLACRESNAGDTHRAMLFSPAAHHTGLTHVFSGRLARGIRNRLMEELQPHAARIPRYPVQNWLTGVLKQAALAQQRPDLMSLWSGQGASLLRHRDARTLMAALVAEMDGLTASRNTAPRSA